MSTAFIWDAHFIDERRLPVECKGETDGLDPDGDRGESAWAAAGLGEGEEYTALQVVDIEARRVLEAADATGAYDGHRSRFLEP